MPQDDKLARQKDDLDPAENIELEDHTPATLDLEDAVAWIAEGAEQGGGGQGDRVMVFEPPPFRFFGTRIREAVRVLRG